MSFEGHKPKIERTEFSGPTIACGKGCGYTYTGKGNTAWWANFDAYKVARIHEALCTYKKPRPPSEKAGIVS